MIYVASPYTHVSPVVQKERYEKAMEFCAVATKNKLIVYSPVVHWHPISVRYGLPGDAAFWHKHNMEILRHCARMIVLKLQGWEVSKGVQSEISIAETLMIPIDYIEYEDAKNPNS